MNWGDLSDKDYMRIDFNQLQSKNIEDPAVTAAPSKSGSSKSTSNTSVFAADGIMLGHSEDNILSRDRSKKRSVMDEASQADAMGVQTQMDQMLVVSQTMSPQDAKKLADEGYDMSSMDPSDAVNSLDRIKITLAEAGVNVAGYTNTVSADQVAEVTGRIVSPDAFFTPETTDAEIEDTLTAYDLPATKENTDSVREAINMASELQAPTDNTRLFMASEGMEPTIENVFTAEYSSGSANAGGNSRYVADDTGYVSRAGNIDVTEPAFEKQITDVIEQAGYEATDEIKEDAVTMINSGVPLTDETLRIYEDTKDINIKPLKKEVMDAIASGGRGKDAYLIADYKNIKAERVTKEAALTMALDTNLKNLDKDITIDTGYLERDVESLKAKEKEVFDLLGETLDAKAMIKEAPAALIAADDILDVFASVQRAVDAGTELKPQDDGAITLGTMRERASDLTREYERMDQTYEAVGTEVRADLGDSIKKAFANTDFSETLKDLGMEHTPANERALRIASYSRMEFTSENIDRISAADNRLSEVLDKLTPGRVLNLIRDNVNPLDISVQELDSRLTAYEDMEDRPVEDFAKYLVRERDQGNITEEESASYIGIYRLVNAINTGDHRAVGALVASGAEMTFSNLLKAVRSGHKAHIDQYIDSSFSGLDSASSGGSARIDQMIRTAFSSDQDQESYEQEAYEEDARKFHEAAKAEAEVLRALQEADIPRSADNINAYEQLMQEGGNRLLRELYGTASEKSRERMKTARERTLEKMSGGDADGVKEAFDEMVKAELIGALEGETLDIRALQSSDKVLSVKAALADSQEYNIPMDFDGELININLKLRHGENQNSVDIYFETEDFGSVHARFRVTDGIRGALRSDRTAGDEYLRERLDAIGDAVSAVSGKDTDLTIGDKERPDTNEAMDGDPIDNALLYRIAKAALDAMLQAPVQ